MSNLDPVNNYHLQLAMLEEMIETSEKLQEEITLAKNHFSPFDHSLINGAISRVDSVRKSLKELYSRKTDFR